MRVAALQTNIVWEDPASNFERLRPRLRAAQAAGARLVVLPEMFACGFSMDTDAIAEAHDGPSVAFLREQARELGLWVCGSVPERAPVGRGDARPANTLVIAGPDDELHRYRKRHPFTFAGEHRHYRGGEALSTITLEGMRVSSFICYDLRFADDFWRLAETTDVYLVVANWPARRREHWRTLLRARAIENQAWVVAVNRVGEGGGVDYAGDSAIIDPWGETVVSASRDETMLLADVTAERVAQARRKFPVLQDRRG